VTLTHNAYLDNGTNIGLTVGRPIVAYVVWAVNIPEKVERKIFYFGNSKTYFRIPASSSFLISSA
jgi:hypothetical protein